MFFAASIYKIAVLALVSSVCGAQDADSTHAALNLLTRDSVLIARPAQAVWPMIVHDSAWKKTVKLQHVDGPLDAAGEIIAARLGDPDSPILFYLQTMEMVPLKRRTMKLYNVAGGPLIGFASWELEQLHGQTKVTYRVYAEFPSSAAPSPEQQQRYTSENETRFRQELATLKRLVEAH